MLCCHDDDVGQRRAARAGCVRDVIHSCSFRAICALSFRATASAGSCTGRSHAGLNMGVRLMTLVLTALMCPMPMDPHAWGTCMLFLERTIVLQRIG